MGVSVLFALLVPEQQKTSRCARRDLGKSSGSSKVCLLEGEQCSGVGDDWPLRVGRVQRAGASKRGPVTSSRKEQRREHRGWQRVWPGRPFAPERRMQ